MFWMVLVALATAIAVMSGADSPVHAGTLRVSAGNGQAIVITSGTLGSAQHAVFDLGSLGPGQSRSLPLSIRNETGGQVTVRLDRVTFPGERSSVLTNNATVTLNDGNTVLGTGGADSTRLIGASTLVQPGTDRRLTADVSLPASAGQPGSRGHSLTAEFSFTSLAGAAPIGTGITTGSGPALPATAESLAIFHGMVWASLAAFAAALVLGALLALRWHSGTETADDTGEGTRR